MFSAPMDLSRARLLVTNDDGYHAPGIKLLERVACSLSPDVWVVAPEVEQSAASHAITLRRPLRVKAVGERQYTVDGTPPDCMVVAIARIMADHKPTLVLSGVNSGANLAEDVVYSGTIAAAREATILGVPALAFSLVNGHSPDAHWDTAEHYAPILIRQLAQAGWPTDVCVSINFPDRAVDQVAGVTLAGQGRRKSGVKVIDGVDPGGRPYVWIADFSSNDTTAAASDLAAVAKGMVSVTPLYLDATHLPTFDRLRNVLR